MTHSLIFFGSDQYSAIVLRQLLTTNYHILSVITDQKQDPAPVEKLAIKHNLKVGYYPDFNHSLITKDTLGLCASFDHLIPTNIIKLFAGNLYNLHPSLLPQYRNVSPVQYAIALGDKETGITLFRISPTIDNGEIIAQVSEPIHKGDTTPTLTIRLFTLGAKLFIDSTQRSFTTLRLYDFKPTHLVFTHRLTRASGYIEWSVLQKLLTNQSISPSDTQNELLRLQHTTSLDHLIRALTPWPGVWSLVPTRKGNLRISIPYQLPTTNYQLLIAGKPTPITLADFTKYYL